MNEPPADLFALFERVCGLSPEEQARVLADLERSAPERARELRVLLAADAAEESNLERELPDRLVADALASAQAEERIPARIGPYTLRHRLGRGGMGDVYLAWQEAPIQRAVALKVIRLGLSSPEILERFEQECQALALLDHPHIARILDTGVDEHGRPYLAMELVLGEPLLVHCERHALDRDARLALFVELCQAVDHAHKSGVLHRDLKPSNVMVTDAGCKVIDFGVAKLVGPEHGASLATASGQFLGTPAYMSPEQAGANEDIDTRTDVYSLGVLLYELVVGTRPCADELARATSLSEMLRVVREQEAGRPSTLRPGVPRDLDWIAMKALEKDRERRYRSPAELAADVERFRRHEPIRARPASVGYRLRKLARRRRAAVIAAGMTLVALLGVLAFTSASYVQAKQAERRYRAANDNLRRLSDLQLLREARHAADELWPIDPERIGDLRHWLTRYAEPLAERRALHAARRAELQTDALPYTAADSERERSEHPRAEELHAAQAIVAHHSRSEIQQRSPSWESYVEKYSPVAALLELEVSKRRTWRLTSPRDQWEHDALAELEEELARFFDPDPYAGVVASVERRIAEAERVAAAVREAEEDGSWAEACSAIRASPRYGGLDLEPERSLVPLGFDPHSGLFEFWHVQTGERPRPSTDPSATSPWQLADSTGLVLVLIPGGTYRLGAQREKPAEPHYDPLARADELVHEVELWPFFLAKYELTLAQWKRATGRFPAVGYGDHWPACDVDWNECTELLWRHGLVLPSEAQWEAAARGGTSTPWWCGATTVTLAGCANVAERKTEEAYGRLAWIFSRELEDPWGKLAPVDAVPANPFGLHHAAGNVIEWCADPYVSAGWVARAGDGLRSPQPGESAFERSARGGGWQRPAESARSAERESFVSETRLPYLGVRPARPLDRHRARLAAESADGAGQ